MSTWTNRRGLLPLICLLGPLALAGCVTPEFGGSSAPASMAVLGRSVTVAGPQGYCVDSAASRDTATSAFVLLGSCAALARSSQAGAPRSPAILTASVIESGADIAAQTDQLSAFFRSEAGRRALSRSADPATVEVREGFGRDGAFFLRVSDLSDDGGAGAPVEPEYWRAILTLNGRLVTLTALGHRARPLTAEAKRAALEAFLKRVRAANASAAEGQG